MPYLVAQGATLRCSQGAAPSQLVLTPRPYAAGGRPLATVLDHQPILNVIPFGMCMSSANPAVAMAQGAPQPCVLPQLTRWQPGAANVSHEQPGGMKVAALTSDSTCDCPYAGQVRIEDPATTLEVK